MSKNNMENFLSDKVFKITTLAILIMLLIGHCSNSSKINLLKKQNQKLTQQLNSLHQPLDMKQTRDVVEQVMFDFLIFEDDLDKNKTNLTEIKNRIGE